MFRILTLLLLMSGIMACATGSSSLQDVTYHQDCGSREGVTLLSNAQIRVSLGQRPSAGYSLHHRQTNNNGYVNIHYREMTPDADQLTAQIITTPCMFVSLPENWHSVQVINDDNGQMWEFRSQPTAIKSAEES